MSVPESKRNPQPVFLAGLKARELAAHTLKICTNPKVFDPRFNHALTGQIIGTATGVYICVRRANNVRVDKGKDGWEERAEHRRELQDKAAMLCNDMLAYIDLAKPVYHLRANKVKYWAKLTVEARTLIQAWRDADTARYK